MKTANAVLSAIAVLGFTRSHALGTLVNQKDEQIARANDSRGREGKSFDHVVERVATPLGLNVLRSEDRAALYSFIKLVDGVALPYDMLAQAEASADSMGICF